MSNQTNRLLKKKSRKNSRTTSATTNKNQTNAFLVLIYHMKEGILLILSAISIFFLVSFLSYHPFDPGWSRTAHHLKIANIAGNLGAWCADLFLYFFGVVAYLLPVAILYSCSIMLFNKKFTNNILLWSIRTFGFIITVLSGCALVSLFNNHKIIKISLMMPISIGGVLGDLLSEHLFKYANFWGAILILLPSMLAGITALTGISWLNLTKIAYLLTSKLLIIVTNNLVSLIKIITNNIFYVTQKIAEINQKRGAIKKQLNIIDKTVIVKQPSISIQTIPDPAILPKQENEQYTAAKNFIKQIKNNKINFVNKSIAKNAHLPSINLLEKSNIEDTGRNSSESLPDPVNIQAKLADFGISTRITNIFPGPVVTRVELELAPGTKASKITGLSKDLARSLSVPSVRVVEVIPGKSVVGLEIPNTHRRLVRLRDILSSEQYLTSSTPLTLALGKDIAGVPVVADLSRMPHLLVAGTTGSGKSVGINVMLLSLLFKVTPDEVRLILIDPKMLELSIYEGIPHLLTPVVTDMKDAANVLNWCVFEMERRYKLMSNLGVRNLLSFNHKVQTAANLGNPISHPFYNPNVPIDFQNKQYLEKLPYIVVMIDEFADMMMVVGKKVEEQIARIAQKARAAGIHMILATQRPSVDVITGLIKANIPTRIAFQVSSRIDSRTILDQQGAEQLLGYGDLLYLPPGSGIPVRIHGAFVSDDEVHKVVAALKATSQEAANNNFINMEQIQNLPETTDNGSNSSEDDPLYDEAVAIVISSRKASISYLQRRLKIGFNRAANLIEEMQNQGVVSQVQNNGIREVLAPASSDNKY
jgi:S-DNA-T family DNA segregation ATPase FtsK/SpoIIIE